MALIHKVAASATQVGVGLGMAACGLPITSYITAAAVGSAALAAFVHEHSQKAGLECEKRLEKLVKRTEKQLISLNPAYESDYEDAAGQLDQHITALCPTPEQFARLIVADGGDETAIQALLTMLRERGYPMDEPRHAELARHVVVLLLDVPFSDGEFFRKAIEPYLMKQIGRGVGEANAKLDQLLAHVTGGDANALAMAQMEVRALRAEGAVKDQAIEGFLTAIGATPVSPEQLPALLVQFAQRYQTLLGELQRRNNLPAEFAGERAAAGQALQEGDLDRTAALLAALSARVSEWAREQREAADQAARYEAEILIDRGDLEQARLRYLDAAELYALAGRAMPPGDPTQVWRIGMREAGALNEHGERFLSPETLRRAVDVLQAVVAAATREAHPRLWGAAQVALGNVYRNLGTGGDDEALRDAVSAFDRALEVLARDETPDIWAMAQSNLGATLAQFAIRGDESVLDRADAALSAALEVFSKEKSPALWASALLNLATMLIVRDGMDGAADAPTMRRAIDLLEEALGVYTRDSAPEQFATVQKNMGTAYFAIGDPESLRHGVEAFESAANAVPRERSPAIWASNQVVLGTAISEIGRDEETLLRAVACFDAALDVFTTDNAPAQWANALNARAYVHIRLAERTGERRYWLAAVSELRGVLTVWTADFFPLGNERTRNLLYVIETQLASEDAANSR